MSRVVMVMGVQRSGTNALFKCLTSGPGVTALNEAPDNAAFEACDLRPEPALRALLQAAPGPVVLKPINESKRRPVAAVLEEFAAHELRAVWIFRDPVNCYHSHVVRWEGFRDRPEAFAAAWCARNRSALAALAAHPERLALVRYEDLVADPRVLSDLAAFLGLRGAWLFRADSRAGRQALPPEIQRQLEADTAEVLASLDSARTFRRADPLPPWPARAWARARGRWLRGVGFTG
ncbi:MAG: sulfotransferase [Pseudomonadota bacterium]